MPENLVVGDVVTGRLRDPFVSLAAEGEDIAVAKLFFHFPGHRVDVVADQSHRTGGEDGD